MKRGVEGQVGNRDVARPGDHQAEAMRRWGIEVCCSRAVMLQSGADFAIVVGRRGSRVRIVLREQNRLCSGHRNGDRMVMPAEQQCLEEDRIGREEHGPAGRDRLGGRPRPKADHRCSVHTHVPGRMMAPSASSFQPYLKLAKPRPLRRVPPEATSSNMVQYLLEPRTVCRTGPRYCWRDTLVLDLG